MVREVQWDQKKIKAFWDGTASDADMADTYFSRQRGRSLLRRVRPYLPERGHFVDLGCGPGYFIDHLLAAGYTCEGADLSQASIDLLNTRLQKHPLFRQGRVFHSPTEIPFEKHSVDVAFSLETLEHLLDADLSTYLANVYALIRPAGLLVVTVPLEENLDLSKVICPTCGCRFHRMQHVRSFSTESLEQLMEISGFRTLLCSGVMLWPQWSVYLRSLTGGRGTTGLTCPECSQRFRINRNLYAVMTSKLRSRTLRHLLFIGRKDG